MTFGIIVISNVLGCALFGTATKQGVARTTYEAEQSDCVDQYNTRAEIDACRASVRQRWGKMPIPSVPLDAGPTDGGDQ